MVLAYKGDNEYRYLIEKYDWNINTMMYILDCESSGNPKAINWKDNHRGCKGSFGLFQIACIHFGKYSIDETNWDDAELNIETAYQVWLKSGYNAWHNCYTRYLSTL